MFDFLRRFFPKKSAVQPQALSYEELMRRHAILHEARSELVESSATIALLHSMASEAMARALRARQNGDELRYEFFIAEVKDLEQTMETMPPTLTAGELHKRLA